MRSTGWPFMWNVAHNTVMYSSQANSEDITTKDRSTVCGSGWVQEKIVIQIPRYWWIQLLLLLCFLFCLRGDEFGCLWVCNDVLGDQRSLLPFQPVSNHVTFTLKEINQVQSVNWAAPSFTWTGLQWECTAHLDLKCSSALQHVATNLFQ